MTKGQFDPSLWAGPDGEVGSKVEDQSRRCLRAYAENPLLIEEHANIERATAQGGYGRRQIYELIQNGADELISQPGGRIHVLLTEDALYCANEGKPISARGVEAILSAALSVKRGDEIGRFGMGFKSVLGVTDLPDFFSRTGSFRFDAEWAEKQIRAVNPDVERTPTLRVAYPLDPDKATRSDNQLRTLMAWASTVVRLPIDRKRSHWLAPEIEDFPREFLLFSAHVGELVLEDRVEQIRRTIKLTPQEDHLVVTEGDDSTAWRIFRKVHRPSREARREAGELADRDTIPMVWAVPTEGARRAARGTFWAFFPTHYVTTLRGILNAPWKTNEDRQNLLEGPFNEELLSEASRLIVDNLAELSTAEDPGSHLDLMPARGRESPNWADTLITERVYELASAMASLPDQTGTLREPVELDCHPPGLPEDALKEWADYPGRPVDWCHPTIDGRERRPRAERLLDQVHVRISNLDSWLEALVEDGTAAGSVAALRTARRVLSADANTRDRILTAEIVLSNSDAFSSPDPDLMSLPGEYVSAEGELLTVHPEVMEDPVARTFLLELGLREGDPLQEVRGIVAAQDDDLQPEEWESFWRLVRQAGHTTTAPVLTDSDNFVVHAKAIDGAFSPVFELLVPGPIVSPDRGEDSGVCLDTSFHADDIELLQNLGLLSAPRLGGGEEQETWFRQYVNDCRRTFVDTIGRDPHWNMLIFDDRPFAGPLSPLLRLSAEGRARFTEAALAADPDAGDWIMYHRTRSQDYPQIEMMNPLVWLLVEEGRLNTSLGVKKPNEAVGIGLKQWSEFFPVAQNISYEQGMLLDLPVEMDDLRGDHWKAAMKVAHGVVDDRQRGRFYAMACRYRRKPAHILARVGKAHQLEKPNAVTAVNDEREMQALANQGTPVLLCDKQDLPVLVERWGLVAGESQVRTSVDHIPATSPVPVADRWPLLAFALPSEARHYELVPCESLRLVTVTSESRHTEDIEFHVTESSILHDASMPEFDVLRHIVNELDLDLEHEDLVRIVEQRVENERRGELDRIASIEDSAERLIAAVGVEPLRRLAGEALIEGAERLRGELDDKTLAELALAANGVNTLKVLRDDLEQWTPPTQWAGSRRAREFVTSLGFDITYAGFESAQREALLPVDGPLKLPELHDFQRSISNDLRELLAGQDGNRGLVSLPTGAGKTRVAVQTLVEAFKEGDTEGPILWVAQSDELCEQAVQSWREVWRSEGPEARMHVSRLWGSNEVSAIGSGLQVVVATIQKLRERRDRSDYEWVWKADSLIIDEAHRAITPEYTALLETFGMSRGKRGIPLIGLTATPFRGENERETQQLASRYGNRLLDVAALGDNPYAALQEMGVLAKVEHEILPGSEVDLSDAEREHLDKFERMPPSVEGRLGVDADRNEILLRSIGDLPEDWTVLLFAVSVENAQNMAALLSLEGVPARAISAETESGARRHYVEEFRKGRIRVLTNYNVLTQGFDAPAVRAVYVARPTFSTNLYQQMVGRGLRGPLNGGGETCRIVNVADNFLKFGEQLAFHRFDYLWDRSASFRIHLTAEQVEAIERPPESGTLVVAAAGTGKTEVLTARINFLIDKAGLHPGGELLILSFSRSAVRAITERVRRDGSGSTYTRAQTFDSFATGLLAAVHPGGAWSEQSYDGRIRAAIVSIQNDPKAQALLAETQHVLVDEIQDLVGVRRELVVEVIRASSGGFTMLGDPSQAIYDWQENQRGGRPSEPIIPWLESRLGFDVMRLDTNFRALTETTRKVLDVGPLVSGSDSHVATAASAVSVIMNRLPHVASLEQAKVAFRNPGRTTAVLCRTNGQALAVSSVLHSLEVVHRLQRRAADRALSPWIGNLIGGYPNAGMTRRGFSGRFERAAEEFVVPEEEEAWRLLKRMDGSRGDSLDLGRLAARIRTGQVPDQLTWTEPSNVIVSTVHRAKGLEFDSVFLTEPWELPEENTEALGELRVMYVGLTRARSDIAVLSPPKHFYGLFPAVDRWAMVGFKKWQRFGIEVRGGDVHHMHPGGAYMTDVDQAQAIQEYLVKSISPGDPVELQLHKASKVGLPRAFYHIIHDGNVIGVTSEEFASDLYSIMKVNGTWEVRWPEGITGLHIEFVDTVAGTSAAGSNAGLGPTGIWLRPRVGGMGTFTRTRGDQRE